MPPQRKINSQEGGEGEIAQECGLTSANKAMADAASGSGDQRGDREENIAQIWQSIPRHTACLGYTLDEKSGRKRRIIGSDLGFEAGIF